MVSDPLIELRQRMHEIAAMRIPFQGAPNALFADNGAEFTGQMVDL